MSPEQFLIDGDAVAQAYRVTGLTPDGGVFLYPPYDTDTRQPTCGCPLAALYLALGGDKEAAVNDCMVIAAWAHSLLGESYAESFMGGFDDARISPTIMDDPVGFANGRTLRHRFLGADA